MTSKQVVLLTCIVFLALSVLAPQNASAHATPITYEPEAASIIETAPEQIRIRFSERIEQGASGITVYGPDGSRVDDGKSAVDASDARFYGTRIKNGGEGTYAVSWQVVSSDDGHFTKGAFAFSVGKATGNVSSGQIQIQHITTIPQAGTIGIELLGQTLILGVLLFLALLWRPLKRTFSGEISPHIKKVENGFSILIVGGVLLILIGALSFVVLKTFDLQQLRPDNFIATLETFLNTVDGSYALGRAVVGLLLLGLFLASRKSIFSGERMTKSEMGLIALIFLMLLARARVSHAAASHFSPWFSILMNAVHLFLKEMWVGGVIVASSVIAPLLLRSKGELSFAFFSTAFSKITSIAFAGVGVTGAYIVWLHLKDPAYLFSTQWGTRFIILSLLGGVLFVIRLYHQFLVDRSAITLCDSSPSKKNRCVVAWSTVTLSLEAFVGVALLFVTSFIIITTPPYATERFTFERTAVTQEARITMSVHPFEPSRFLITVEDAKTRAELAINNLVVTITNAEKGIGPIVVNAEQRFMGGYVFPQSLLAPSGEWKIDITAQRPRSYDAVASFNVDYPEEIGLSRINPDTRSFGWFEIIILIATLLILGLSLLLYRFSKNLSNACAKLTDTIANTEGNNKWTPPLAFAWLISFIGLIALSAGIGYLHNAVIKTDFQKLCEKNGHFWLQSIPVKDGQALSPDTVTGCFLDVGLYHFADKREYEFFFQGREIIPELTYAPSTPIAGQPTDITVLLNEVKDGRRTGPATEIGTYHDRILHVQVIGEDLKTFAHIHSEDIGPVTDEMKKGGRFPLRYTFPKAGRYALNVDYVVSGREYSNVALITVTGNPQMERLAYNVPENPTNTPQTKEFDGYHVTFTAPRKVRVGENVGFSYSIEKDGAPVTDLVPYLGAAMHFGIVRNDLARFFHTHGEASQPGSVWFQQLTGKYFKYHMHFAPDRFGPNVITPPLSIRFTTPGMYTVFGEFKHGDTVVVTNFEVEVE